MRHFWKRWFVIAVLLAFLVVIAISRMRRPEYVRLRDGTVLAITAVRLGDTNIFTHGSWLDKMFGAHLGTNTPGFNIFNLTVTRPEVVMQYAWRESSPFLTVELQLVGTNYAGSELLRPSFNRSCRVIHWGDDHYQYFEEPINFRNYRDGYFGYLNTSSFSRRSKIIHIKIEQRRRREDPWTTLGEFTVQNPNPLKAKDWVPEPFPIRKSKDGFAVELSDLKVYQPREGLRRWRDIWNHRVDYHFRFFQGNQVVTNWAAHQISVRDATGNEFFQGASKEFTNGFVLYPGFRTVDPSTVWQVRAHFSPDSGFTNIFSFQVPVPLPAPIKTNFQGLEAKIEFVHEYMLSVSIPTNAVNSRLLFLDATNNVGNSIKESPGSWGQHSFWQKLKLEPHTTTVLARVAIVPDLAFEFTVKPTMEQ
jgi:hypothetical protein